MKKDKNIKILIISKYFMPRNTAGVYRVIGFLKYFGENDINCSILISSDQDTKIEGKLSHTIPKSINIHTAYEFIMPKFKYSKNILSKAFNKISNIIERKILPIDEFILWVPSAVYKAKKILSKSDFDAVLVTTPPRSIQLIGVFLKILGAKCLIADFRDSWTHQRWAPPASWLSRNAEKLVLRHADMIVANTPRNKILLERDYPFVKNKVIVVPNGYFPEDTPIQSGSTIEQSDKFRLVYTGELYEGMFEGIACSIKLLKDKHPDLSQFFSAEFAGLMYEDDHKLIKELGIDDVIKYHGFISYEESVELVQSSDMVLFCLQNTEKVSNWVPSKLYFYLGQKKTVLALIPDGDAADIIRQVNAGYVFSPEDHQNIANILDELLFTKKEKICEYNFAEWEKYSRKEQVKYLAKEIKTLLNKADRIQG